ncbi:MAG TPA: DUF2065 domain-containing protein [Rhodanobacteraceae bacterium]|nr:DUF2065 domain-containing protein [Rhodanobacteraceae bacterium]
MTDLSAALCLVLVIEGLVLFVVPAGWQKMMRDAAELDPRVLRWCGLAAMVVGALALRLVR